MPLIDRVIFTGEVGALAWKFPSDALSTTTQVIVNESQEALFFKGGQALDVLGPGTHTLSTGNIPVLSKLLNLPFGGQTPFTAEVWYVDKTVRRDLNWGTATPISVRDKETNQALSVRAFGNWGMRIADTRAFLTQIIGTQRIGSTDLIQKFFVGEICQRLTSVLSAKMLTISFMEINAHLNDIAEATKEAMNAEFVRFGIEVINFNVINVNIPTEQQERLNAFLASGIEDEIRLKRLGGSYGEVRKWDTLEAAANNEGGNVGSMMTAGLGLGLGFGAGIPAGQQLGQQFQQEQPVVPTAAPVTPVVPVAAPIAPATPVAPAADPVAKLTTLKSMLDSGLITQAEYDARKQAILDAI